MLRNSLSIVIVLALMFLGGMFIFRGQSALGVVVIVVGVLRAGMVYFTRRKKKSEPEIRLNLEE